MKLRIAVLLSCVCGLLLTSTAMSAGSLNGRAGTMQAYYDGTLFTINFFKLPSAAEGRLIADNQSINTIYMSDAGLPGGAPFISVLDAIQGDGFNPLWVEIQIAFTAGHTPRQLTSDTDVLAAQASGEITLTNTGEVYRCAVIGPRKAASGAASAPVSPASAGAAISNEALSSAPTTDRTSWGSIKALYRQ